jgi:toxin ParE1/3/4
MARVLYTRSAETDLLEAWLFIAEEDPVAADRVLDAIDVEANTLSSQPLMGRARPELGEGVRSWPTSMPYAEGRPRARSRRWRRFGNRA